MVTQLRSAVNRFVYSGRPAGIDSIIWVFYIIAMIPDSHNFASDHSLRPFFPVGPWAAHCVTRPSRKGWVILEKTAPEYILGAWQAENHKIASYTESFVRSKSGVGKWLTTVAQFPCRGEISLAQTACQPRCLVDSAPVSNIEVGIMPNLDDTLTQTNMYNKFPHSWSCIGMFWKALWRPN